MPEEQPPPPQNNQPDVWEPEETPSTLIVEKEDVSERDKFRLAKQILAFATLIYAIVAVVSVWLDSKLIQDVWDFTKIAVNSLVAVVIGYYFGKK